MGRYIVEYDDGTDPYLQGSNNQNAPPIIPLRYKLVFLLVLLILIYTFYHKIILIILDLLKSNPSIFDFYLYMESEISNNTLQGLLYMAIFGSLFFLALPSELLFLYYISSVSQSIGIIFIVMLAGNMIGLVFNYFFGYLLGQRVLQIVFKRNFAKYQDKLNRYGGYLLLFGNILPGPIELISIFYGGFKYDFKEYFYICLLGRVIKYLIIMFIFFFFWDSVVFFYEGTIENFLVLNVLYD